VETWYRWQDVLKMTEFIVVSRPGHDYDIPAGAKVRRLETLALPVSSSEIRATLARGERPADLPETVFQYIRQHRLYEFQEEAACSRF
jgi:nicotinate-nucleotide adenylyltransferase